MLSLFLTLIFSIIATNALFQKTNPDILLQKATQGLDEYNSQHLNVDLYLRTYGYMNDNVNDLSEDYAQQKTTALKSLQKFAGLEITGEEDEATLNQMMLPRCGMKDLDKPANAKWNVTEITYRFLNFTNDLPEATIRYAFQQMLDLWGSVTPLTFTEIKTKSIMETRFVTRKHPPCRSKFDGPGRVLAHAYYPMKHSFGGDMHFDDDETFKYKEGRGYDIGSIALHEAGHALGLGHTKVKGNIMSPWYSGRTTLGENDIKRIQDLYGKKY